MEINEADFPDGLKYDENHNWAKEENSLVVFGITKYGLEKANEIAFIELPKKGQKVEKGKNCGNLESAKWSGEIIAPVSGEIVEVNEELFNEPGKMNKDPYNEWIAKIRPNNIEELNSLMDKAKVIEWLKSKQ